MFLPEELKIVFGVLMLIIFALGFAARKLPHVQWLQGFRLDRHLSEEQRAKLRRRGNRMAGYEMMIAGLVIPLAYVAVTLMTFNQPTRTGLLLAGGASVLCFAFGIAVIARNR